MNIPVHNFSSTGCEGALSNTKIPLQGKLFCFKNFSVSDGKNRLHISILIYLNSWFVYVTGTDNIQTFKCSRLCLFAYYNNLSLRLLDELEYANTINLSFHKNVPQPVNQHSFSPHTFNCQTSYLPPVQPINICCKICISIF